MVVLNKVDLLRGDYAIGQATVLEEMEAGGNGGHEELSPKSDISVSNVTPVDAKMSFKKKLLQRKRDSIAKDLESSTDSPVDSRPSSVFENPSEEGVLKQSGFFTGNTDYAEYKDEYNEREGENSM